MLIVYEHTVGGRPREIFEAEANLGGVCRGDTPAGSFDDFGQTGRARFGLRVEAKVWEARMQVCKGRVASEHGAQRQRRGADEDPGHSQGHAYGHQGPGATVSAVSASAGPVGRDS